MDIQELFYIVATIALALIILLLMGLIYLTYRLQKFIRFSTDRVDHLSKNVTEYLSSAGRTWGKVTLASLALRTLRGIIFKR